MTATLVELTAGIVSSHAAGTEMSSDDLIQEINRVFTTLKKLETEGGTMAEGAAAPGAPAMSIKKAFQNDQVCCLICGKTGFKTLTRHLKQAHDIKPGQYRKQFNIPCGPVPDRQELFRGPPQGCQRKQSGCQSGKGTRRTSRKKRHRKTAKGQSRRQTGKSSQNR